MANCLPQSLAASKGRALICEGTAFRATQEKRGIPLYKKLSAKRTRNWPDEIESRSGANNPKGIATSSPRLRGTSYLGKTSKQNDNRNAVAAMSRGSCSIELFRDTAEIRVERVARGFVAQKRTTVFGGEDEMNVNGGKGMWHVERMVRRVLVCQSQRIASIRRRLARR